MKIHILQHIEFEKPGYILNWAKRNGHELIITKFFEAFKVPFQKNIDLLIIMGGPMSIYDEEEHTWLVEEKIYIREMIRAGKKVLGICLGSQFIADALDAEVFTNEYKEIGWFGMDRNPNLPHELKSVFPKRINAFHWHGQSYKLPEDAINLYSSEATVNQGFIYDDRVIALQFHLEITSEIIEDLCEYCSSDIDGSKYVQSVEELKSNTSEFDKNKKILFGVLNYLEGVGK